MKLHKKRLMVWIVAGIIILSLQPIGYALETKVKKNLEAWYNMVTIVVNGKEMSSDIKPFIVNGTTYVPLRMMANIFNKDIQWDPVQYKAIITDKPNPEVEALKNQLIGRDIEISRLQNKIEELEAELEEEETMDLDDLEDQLNDDYDEYEDIEFDISLSGDEDDIEVKIEVDLSDYGRKWNSLSERDKEDYLQDICDDILDVFEDADIEGYIEDTDADKELLTFDISSRGDVRIEEEMNIDDLEDLLNDNYDEYEDVEFDISLWGDEEDILVEILVDLDDYQEEWDALSDGDKEDYLQDICDEILDVFEDADIEGYIEDSASGDTLLEFDTSLSGDVRITD